MRVYLQVVVFLVVMLLAQPQLLWSQSLPSNVPTWGLVSYYPLDGDVNDVGGSNIHGALEHEVGATDAVAVANRKSSASSALQFGGYYNRNWSRVPRTDAMTLDTALSISFWMRIDHMGGMDVDESYVEDEAAYTIFAFGGDGNLDVPGLRLQAVYSDVEGKTLSFFLRNTNEVGVAQPNINVYSEYKCYRPSEWIHCAFVIHRNNCKIYINGTLVEDDILDEEADFSAANTYDLYLGRMLGGDIDWYPYGGILDEFGMWNRPLTADEITGLYDGYEDPLMAGKSVSDVVVNLTNWCLDNPATISITADGDMMGYALDDITDTHAIGQFYPSVGTHHVYATTGCDTVDSVVTVLCECAITTDVYDSICYGDTTVVIYDTILYEGFNGGLTAGWTTEQTGALKWAVGSALDFPGDSYNSPHSYYPAQGAKAAFCVGSMESSSSLLLSPAVEILKPAETTMQFWLLQPNKSLKYGSLIYDAWNDFYLGFDEDGDRSLWAKSDEQPINEWTDINLSLSFAGSDPLQGRFVFQSENSNGMGTGIDELLVMGPKRVKLPAYQGVLVAGDTVSLTRIYKAQSGCDSVVNYHWRLKGYVKVDTNVENCDSYTWTKADSTFRSSTVYTDTFKLANGCDSVVTAYINIKKSTSSSIINQTVCDTFFWDVTSQYYTSSQLLKHTLDGVKNQAGCDTTVQVSLTVYYRDTLLVEPRACDSFYWDVTDSTYKQSTLDFIHKQTIHGCDSVISFNLTVNPTTMGDTLVQSACDSYEWVLDNPRTLDSSGVYHDTVLNSNQCNHLVWLNLTVDYSSYGDTTVEDRCDSFRWSQNSTLYTHTGLYTDVIHADDRCDSIVSLQLTIRNSSEVTTSSATFCDRYHWMTTDETYTESGIYRDTLTNVAGCDSVVELDLTIYQTPQLICPSDTTIEICGTATFRVSGADYYTVTPNTGFSAAAYTDSISELLKGLRQSQRYRVEGYRLGDELVNNGDFTQGNVGFTSDMTFAPSASGYCHYGVQNRAQAYSSDFRASDHTTPSLTTGKFLIADGCTQANSVVWSQTVQVQPYTDYVFSMWGVSVTTSSPAQLKVYMNGLPQEGQLALPSVAGQWKQMLFKWNSGSKSQVEITIRNQRGEASGNDFGVDDISLRKLLCSAEQQVMVGVHYDTIRQNVCDAYTWRETGLTYSESGDYERHISNADRCDSVRVLHLNISNTFVDTANITICTRYMWRVNGQMYEASGLYRHDIIHEDNDELCDSVRYLKLTILECGDIPLPDNVDEPNCTTPPPANAFAMKTLFTYGNNAGDVSVNCMSTPMVGDVDGDGTPELIVCRDNGGNPWNNNALLMVDGRTGQLKYTVELPWFSTSGQCISVADVDGDGLSEVFLLANDNFVYCYSALGRGMLWRSVIRTDARYLPMVVDINSDGRAELVCGGYIFDAQTGTLLLQGTLQNTGRGYGAPHCDNGYGRAYYMQALADFDHDNQLEIAAGNSLYKPVITNNGGTAGNSWRLLRQAERIDGITYYDGQTFLADFDNDGDVDVCVLGYSKANINTTHVYVWEGQTSEMIAYKVVPLSGNYDGSGNSPSIPFCGDLDGNGTPEIIFNHPCAMFVLSYDDTLANRIRVMHRSTTYAETAGFTVFDFNQDGKNEIVYRSYGGGNPGYLAIIDGVTLNEICPKQVSYTGTICEYPIVADVDADGHADIISIGGHRPWSSNSSAGYVSVYSSQQVAAWGSARSVWNQWAYNSVNINENMTVPQYQFDVASIFPNGKEPFNGFLRQSPRIDQNGDVYVSVSNVDATLSRGNVQYSDTGALVWVDYCNMGDNNLIAPYHVAIYDGHYRGVLVDTFTVNHTIYMDSCSDIEMFIPMRKLCHIKNDSIAVVLNDGGFGIGQNGGQQYECDTTNNVVMLPFKPVIPKADTMVVEACDSYLWAAVDMLKDTSGLFSDTTSDMIGCDSVRWLDITIHRSFNHTLDTSVCDLFYWDVNQTEYTASDEVTEEFKTIHECDSIRNLNLTVYYSYSTSQQVEACNRYFWEVDRRYYDRDIVHTEMMRTVHNCDSAVTLNLKLYHSYADTIYDTVCYKSERNFWGQVCTETGHYTYKNEMMPGCDSVHELYLNVRPEIPLTIDSSAQCDLLQYTLIAQHPMAERYDSTGFGWSAFPSDPELLHQAWGDTIRVRPQLSTLYTATSYYAQGLACPTQVSQMLTPTVPIEVKINSSTQVFSHDLTQLRASATGSGFTSQQWYVDGEWVSDQRTINYTYDESMGLDSILVQLFVANGSCTDSDSVIVRYQVGELYVPSVMAPSEERIKHFRVIGTGITDYEIYIYNRRGLQVFHSEQLHNYWDGTLPDGTKAPQGGYVYSIRYRTQTAPDEWHRRTGTVTLIR
ncbi:MAG: VCBS repeat-containing protein [Bacteroidales bacterium]|nr:VCBS repeat-containing protein [Candidatus Colimorpha onthohippi]